ncbi:MAG: hypothetical protein ACQEXQ_08090 [Bacillota bacterium]
MKIGLIPGFLLIISGIYFIIQDWPDVSFNELIFIASGVVILINEIVFPSKNANSERTKNIKKQSGYIAYLINLCYIVVIVELYQLSIINSAIAALKFILVGSLLMMPLLSIYYNKKM